MGREIQDERIKVLNSRPARYGDYVLYWMQQSQRADFNHALEFAMQQANERNLPVMVVFGLMDDYPEANVRHYQFMLEGLRETSDALRDRGILFIVQKGSPDKVALHFARNAALIVCDRGYLRHQKQWRQNVAAEAACDVIQVESDVVVPVEEVSDKAEFAARTIRPKIHRKWRKFLVDLRPAALKKNSLSFRFESLDLSDVKAILGGLKLDRSVPPVSHFFRGGTSAAQRALHIFLQRRFGGYVENRQKPETNHVSHLSKYLHFGQISPVQIALAVQAAKNGSKDNKESFLEELIVRRELAQNFCEFTPHYDQFRSLPQWARLTLQDHKADERAYLYSREQLENAQTHDEYWNAAMQEMRFTGYMHNAMRMYWGKKILEWSATPEEAYATTLYLNNKYFLDGRDPNAYTNVGWVFGLHDRPWTERNIFGKVRYMNANGLKRKSDIEAYVRKVAGLVETAKQGFDQM